MAQLSAAAAHEPQNPDVQNTLAVAHLTRGLRQPRAFDLVLALAAADRALEAAPDSPAIRYNRARILSALHLRHQALKAWDAYLEVADDRDAETEVQEFREPLARPDQRQRWLERKDQLERLSGASRQQAIAPLTAEFPYQTRIWAENELLAKWAEAAQRGDSSAASRALDLLRAIAAEVARQRGDHLLAEAMAAIDSAPPGSSKQRLLIDGYRLYATGMEAYDKLDLEAAKPDLNRAQEQLTSAGCPFAGWAAFYDAICLYYSDAGQATSLLKGLKLAYSGNRYPVLNGRIHWLLATALGIQGRYQEGIDSNKEALRLLEAASGEQEAAFVHVLLAETYDPLGEVELGWHHRLKALQSISYSGDGRRTHAMLNEAAQALQRQGLAAQALTFLDELMVNAEVWKDRPSVKAEGHAQRAQAWLALGQPSEAEKEIGKARSLLANAPPSGQTDQLGRWLDIYEGTALAESQPERAVGILTTAFEQQTSAGYEWDRPRYLAERARAYFALQDSEKAREDLEMAVAAYERTRADLTDPAFRMSSFRAAQPAFEALISLNLKRPDTYAMAFSLAERARGRFFLDRRSGHREPDAQHTFPLPDDLASRLPDGTALVQYVVLPEEVVAWVITRESWRMVRLREQKEDMEAQVERLRRDLERGASEQSVRASAAPLFDALVRPLGLHSGLTSLILVPDRFLLALPFAVLYDAQSAHYLIERFTVRFFPSSALLLDVLNRTPRRALGGSALVVGNPTAGDLPFLKHAEDEARRVSTLYGAEPLLGSLATRRRFLEELPDKRIVHVAAHAFANGETPARSRIVLSPERDDGTITTADLWTLDFSSVELVVLAACDSMSGQVNEREALFGLAGGFLAAGATEIVASLWRIEDRGTANLMVAFHTHYLTAGDAATSLRQAILDSIDRRSPTGLAPHQWAAFEVLGNH